MTTQTSATLKTAGVNILALLSAYLLNKVADKNTKFVDTRTAVTNVALQTAQELITNQLTKAMPAVPAVEDNNTQVAQ